MIVHVYVTLYEVMSLYSLIKRVFIPVEKLRPQHGLHRPGEEIAFTTWLKIKSQSQIFSYGYFFDLCCSPWSLVSFIYYCSLRSSYEIMNLQAVSQLGDMQKLCYITYGFPYVAVLAKLHFWSFRNSYLCKCNPESIGLKYFPSF